MLLWFDELNVYMLHVFLLEVVVWMNKCMECVDRSGFKMIFVGCLFLSRTVSATVPDGCTAVPLLLLSWPIFLPVGPL